MSRPPQRFESPCPACTYHGQVCAEGVTADVFTCLEDDGKQPPYSVLIIKWGPEDAYDQHDNHCLAKGNDDHRGGRRLCIFNLDDVPLRALWAEALHLVVQDARRMRAVQELRKLDRAWYRATAHLSNHAQAFTHPAYRKIIALGWPVVPFLLDDLDSDEPRWWFDALEKITGEAPEIPPDVQGNLKQISRVWLDFAETKGWR